MAVTLVARTGGYTITGAAAGTLIVTTAESTQLQQDLATALPPVTAIESPGAYVLRILAAQHVK